ncbi:MAG TPA: hypothetical protein DDZ76_08695 [Xanthomonadales bacterium]|nr:hypothetical protein [Xanthomonadales bacterium]
MTVLLLHVETDETDVSIMNQNRVRHKTSNGSSRRAADRAGGLRSAGDTHVSIADRSAIALAG